MGAFETEAFTSAMKESENLHRVINHMKARQCDSVILHTWFTDLLRPFGILWEYIVICPSTLPFHISCSQSVSQALKFLVSQSFGRMCDKYGR